MAIDPTAPLTPIPPAASPGSQPTSVVLQAMARAALANVTNTLGELVGQPATDPGKPRQGVEQADKASTRDPGRAVIGSASRDGGQDAVATRSPPPETRLMRAVRIAATDAVPRQAGVAPLMADVSAILDRPDTPPEVRSAGEMLLARLPRAYEVSTARGLRRAVEQSGVFLEARLARSGPSTPEGGAQAPAADTDLKAALLVFKGALSQWLASTPAPAFEPGPPDASIEPPTVVGDAGDFGEASTPPAMSAQLSESPDGEATEAPLAPPTVDVRAEDSEDVDPPLRLATTNVNDGEQAASSSTPAAVQRPAADDDVVDPRFGAFLAPSKSVVAHPAQSVKPAATVLSLLGLVEAAPPLGEEAPPPLVTTPLAARGYGATATDSGKPRTPPPPFADGPMAGQRPAPSQLPPQAAPEEIVRHLLKGASAALARQDLMQIASLREVHHDTETGEARPQPARLNLDVPFVTPQGVAVAQFEITRDGGGGAGSSTVGPLERTYRVRFSIDVEPLGPVHALVTLVGSRARVSLWAERAETITRLRAGEESLGAALRQAELTPEIAVHSGPPPVKDSRALGHFVDQAS